MTENQNVDVPVDAADETTDPYAEHVLKDGVGVQDNEATELDKELST